jgi:hypothetical protein
VARNTLTTKIQVPIVRADIVPRPHLIRRLSKGLRGKLVLLSAPAGSGKTSLLVDWISSADLLDSARGTYGAVFPVSRCRDVTGGAERWGGLPTVEE